MRFYYLLVHLMISATLLGCAGLKLPLATVSNAEVSKYEEQYLKEYENLKEEKRRTQSEFKWIQPKNQKEKCNLYVSIDPNDDKTLKTDYSLFWDGECQNGFAYGLGREIEITRYNHMEQIGYYTGGKVADYCVFSKPYEGSTVEGECSSDSNTTSHMVHTTIKETGNDLHIEYRTGKSDSNNLVKHMIITSPFSNDVHYVKEYPNFAYFIQDFRRNESNYRTYAFNIIDSKTQKTNGFSFEILKNGERNEGEISQGQLIRRARLPKDYYEKTDNILNEIRESAPSALAAQSKANIIKEQYIAKICKEQTKIDFMDSDRYYKICYEEEYNEKLRKRINEKLMHIEQAKQITKQNEYEQRLLQLKEREVNAQERSVINQSLQNMNNNLQMQQLNNNLMMNNILPKKHNIYIYK